MHCSKTWMLAVWLWPVLAHADFASEVTNLSRAVERFPTVKLNYQSTARDANEQSTAITAAANASTEVLAAQKRLSDAKSELAKYPIDSPEYRTSLQALIDAQVEFFSKQAAHGVAEQKRNDASSAATRVLGLKAELDGLCRTIVDVANAIDVKTNRGENATSEEATALERDLMTVVMSEHEVSRQVCPAVEKIEKAHARIAATIEPRVRNEQQRAALELLSKNVSAADGALGGADVVRTLAFGGAESSTTLTQVSSKMLALQTEISREMELFREPAHDWEFVSGDWITVGGLTVGAVGPLLGGKEASKWVMVSGLAVGAIGQLINKLGTEPAVRRVADTVAANRVLGLAIQQYYGALQTTKMEFQSAHTRLQKEKESAASAGTVATVEDAATTALLGVVTAAHAKAKANQGVVLATADIETVREAHARWQTGVATRISTTVPRVDKLRAYLLAAEGQVTAFIGMLAVSRKIGVELRGLLGNRADAFCRENGKKKFCQQPLPEQQHFAATLMSDVAAAKLAAIGAQALDAADEAESEGAAALQSLASSRARALDHIQDAGQRAETARSDARSQMARLDKS
ncbi:hypothetical protein JGU66_22630 [Myxococcaceae bacterium JPH2]|nr:hypothetical protein [Myxococcaceae bacterium JPH2]